MMETNEEFSSSGSDVAGIVVRLVLKNFMCHEHLRVDFNKQINFICGKNGSGKSAILTGLVIGLGGKSLDTSRGSNLKSLIKSGRSQAVIEITLTNVGSKAFKPDIYGDEITITRVINENSSLYKIAKPQGRAVNFKKNELTEMLACFKIQINNPLSILNQEVAKTFIKTSNPKDLYKFFITGTLLNELEQEFKEATDITLPLLQRTLKEKKEEVNFVNKDLEEVKNKIEKKKQLIELKKESERLKIEYNWAQVYMSRAEKSKLEKRCCELEKNIEELDKKIRDKDGSQQELLAKKEELREKLKELTKKKEEKKAKAMESERLYSSASFRYKELKHEKKSLDRKLEVLKTGYEQIKERLHQLDQKNAEAAAQRHQIDAKRKTVENNINDLKTLMNTNNDHIKNLNASLARKTQEIESKQNSFNQIATSIVKSRSRLKDLKSNSSDLVCYGNFMPELVQEIDRAHARGSFGKKPVGPLGAFIKLNDNSQFSNISMGPTIESVIGRSMLSAFAVDSQSDFNALKKIFNQLNISAIPTVVISQFSDQIYDVSKTKVRHPQYPSMFDALDFSHPVAANTIIDQVYVENILLLPSDEVAFSLMEQSHSVPKNCMKAVTPSSTFFPAPEYRCYHLQTKNNTTMLQVNKDVLIRELEDSLKQCERKERESKSLLKTVKDEVSDIRASLKKAEDENQRIRSKIVSSELELLRLSTEEDNLTADQEPLKEDIVYREKSMKELKDKINDISVDIDKQKILCDEAKKACDNVSSDSENSEINAIQDKLNEIESAYSELTTNFEKFRSRRNDQKVLLGKVQSSIEKVQEEITLLERKAGTDEQINEDSCRSVTVLKDRISEVNIEIEVVEGFIGGNTIEEITEDLQQQIEKVETIQTLIVETESQCKAMTEKIKKMKAEFEKLRRVKSKKVKANFVNITKLRNYKEELIFDHEARKLSIVVKTGDRNENSTSVLSLSGGERSYSMVAFILALWQEMALPFYFLDEFDIFMDPVNRNLIIKLLMMHARENSNQQFVFFTPNDFKISDTSGVGIFRMVDPRNEDTSQS